MGVNGLRMLPGLGDLCPGTSHSLLWAAVSQSVKGGAETSQGPAADRFWLQASPEPLISLSIPRLARRKQMLSSSSSPSPTVPPLKTSLDSWPE